MGRYVYYLGRRVRCLRRTINTTGRVRYRIVRPGEREASWVDSGLIGGRPAGAAR